MTTVELELDDTVLVRARRLAAQRNASLGEVVACALEQRNAEESSETAADAEIAVPAEKEDVPDQLLALRRLLELTTPSHSGPVSRSDEPREYLRLMRCLLDTNVVLRAVTPRGWNFLHFPNIAAVQPNEIGNAANSGSTRGAETASLWSSESCPPHPL